MPRNIENDAQKHFYFGSNFTSNYLKVGDVFIFYHIVLFDLVDLNCGFEGKPYNQ